MRNFYVEVNGKAVKDYNAFVPACKFFLQEAKDKNKVVNLYELKSHAFKGMQCSNDHYILIDSNNNPLFNTYKHIYY